MRFVSAVWVLVQPIVACGGTEPVELASSYTLSTVQGGAPPQLVRATIECDASVEGGHLTFGPADQFELGLVLLTDCSRGGGMPSQETSGYTGSAHVDGRGAVFHAATGLGLVAFEGEVSATGQLDVSVPGLVPAGTGNELAVAFVPD